MYNNGVSDDDNIPTVASALESAESELESAHSSADSNAAPMRRVGTGFK